MYLIFGSVIGGSPSNSKMGDMKDHSSFSRVPNHGAVHCMCSRSVHVSSVENNYICMHHRGFFVLHANACY